MANSRREVVLNGIAASPGLAMGKAVVFAKRDVRVPFRRIEQSEIEREIARLHAAIWERPGPVFRHWLFKGIPLGRIVSPMPLLWPASRPVRF